MRLKTGPKFLLGLAIVVAAGFAVNWTMENTSLLRPTAVKVSAVPGKIDLPTGSTTGGTGMTQVSLAPADTTYTPTALILPWNATSGLLYANGGATTTSSSLLAKRGVKLRLERQDDYTQMLNSFTAFSKEVAAGNPAPQTGAAFLVIMGDAYGPFVAGAQEVMKKMNQSMTVVGAIGYSRGEDKCMLPAEAKADPQKARGMLAAAVLRDGDWNICVKWASDNAIPINPDEKTYDANALNFVAVDAFTAADEKLIAGACETRPVVVDGKKTGEKRSVCVNGTATWTPGDVKVAKAKYTNGRVPPVAVASTKEYAFQMPAIIIGNKQWMAQNPRYVENLLAGAFEGGERVRSDDGALSQAAAVAAEVFKEESPAYWKKYYKGVVEGPIVKFRSAARQPSAWPTMPSSLA